MTTIEEKMAASAGKVERFLGQLLTTDDKDTVPLYAAMRYSTLAGGKRIRPFLTLEVAELLGGDLAGATYFGAALEMVHTYSLIHDDLPAMDNDDMRRGKPTNHKVYGEANAILAGDALLTGAFELLGAAPLPDKAVRRALTVLSGAAGADGMVGGQVMDLAAEHTSVPFETLLKLHTLKTGALIKAAVKLGIAAADKTEEECEGLIRYADYIGLIFQIVDDVLDVTGDASGMGKTIGKDAEEGKTTFLSFMSCEEAMDYAKKLTEKAKESLAGYPNNETLLLLA
ncbi:MAG: polyprenyl synthetase family protein, partial [Clostridia bacterium]|nr:polyprenyl synthetase family protein [Clostridia bacterium]